METGKHQELPANVRSFRLSATLSKGVRWKEIKVSLWPGNTQTANRSCWDCAHPQSLTWVPSPDPVHPAAPSKGTQEKAVLGWEAAVRCSEARTGPGGWVCSTEKNKTVPRTVPVNTLQPMCCNYLCMQCGCALSWLLFYCSE